MSNENTNNAASSAAVAGELSDEQIVALCGPELGCVKNEELLTFARAVLAKAAPVAAAVPSLADQAAAYIRTGINRAASHIEKQAEAYIQEHASTEPDTGAIVFHYGDAGRDHHSTLVELAEEIRALAAPVTQQGE